MASNGFVAVSAAPLTDFARVTSSSSHPSRPAQIGPVFLSSVNTLRTGRASHRRPTRQAKGGRLNMPDTSSEPGAPPGESPETDSPKPTKTPRPKRGAFPTPKTEIDKAKPYIPDTGEEEGLSEGEFDLPTELEGEEER